MRKDYVQRWLAENPTVRIFLTEKVTRASTRYDYGYNLLRFCEGVGESPERLMAVRNSTDPQVLAEFRKKNQIPHLDTTPPDKDGSYVIVDLLQRFISSGKLVDMSVPNLGAEIEVAKLSKAKRSGLYNAVRAYFKKMRAALPDEDFKIAENSRIVQSKDFSMDGDEGIDEAKSIIQAGKEPYRSLFWIALYGCLGNGELCTLNAQWKEIRKQLRAAPPKDPVRLHFSYRKSNDLPYYTFVPARLFQPYLQCAEKPFMNAYGETVNEANLVTAWHSARERVRFDREVGLNNMRDLWRTDAVKAGVESSVAEFLMGHSLRTIDPNQYNKIYRDVAYTMEQWEKMRKFIDGETQEWKKDVEELREKLDRSEVERRNDIRMFNRQFLEALYSDRTIRRIEQQHGGDLANLTGQDREKYVESRVPDRQEMVGQEKDEPPPIKVIAPGPEADALIEQGWAPKKLQDGRWRLEWLYATTPPATPRSRHQ